MTCGLLASAMPALADDQVAADPPTTTVVVAADPAPTIVAPAATETYNRWDSAELVAGLTVFGVGYGAGVIAAAVSDDSADQRLYVPLIGPWLDLSDRESCDVGNASCDDETTKKVLVVVDGVVQAVGVVMVFDALLFPTRVHRTLVAGHEVHLQPVAMSRGGRGLAVSGAF